MEAQHGAISKITPYASQLSSMARSLLSNGTFGDSTARTYRHE